MGKDTDPLTCMTHLDGHGAATGSTSNECVVFAAPAESPCVVVGVDIMVSSDSATDSSNYGTATIYGKGLTGSGTTSVATRATNAAGGGTLTAYDANAMTLGAAANLEVAATETLTVGWVEAGTSLDLTGAVVAVHYALGTGAGA